jgi:hypothetical protein
MLTNLNCGNKEELNNIFDDAVVYFRSRSESMNCLTISDYVGNWLNIVICYMDVSLIWALAKYVLLCQQNERVWHIQCISEPRSLSKVIILKFIPQILTHTSLMWCIDPLLGRDLEMENGYSLCNRRINKQPMLSNGRWTRSRGNNIQSIARQLTITTISGLLEAAFSVGSATRLYNEDTSRSVVGVVSSSGEWTDVK